MQNVIEKIKAICYYYKLFFLSRNNQLIDKKTELNEITTPALIRYHLNFLYPQKTSYFY